MIPADALTGGRLDSSDETVAAVDALFDAIVAMGVGAHLPPGASDDDRAQTVLSAALQVVMKRGLHRFAAEDGLVRAGHYYNAVGTAIGADLASYETAALRQYVADRLSEAITTGMALIDAMKAAPRDPKAAN